LVVPWTFLKSSFRRLYQEVLLGVATGRYYRVALVDVV